MPSRSTGCQSSTSGRGRQKVRIWYYLVSLNREIHITMKIARRTGICLNFVLFVVGGLNVGQGPHVEHALQQAQVVE